MTPDHWERDRLNGCAWYAVSHKDAALNYRRRARFALRMGDRPEHRHLMEMAWKEWAIYKRQRRHIEANGYKIIEEAA